MPSFSTLQMTLDRTVPPDAVKVSCVQHPRPLPQAAAIQYGTAKLNVDWFSRPRFGYVCPFTFALIKRNGVCDFRNYRRFIGFHVIMMPV